MDTDRLLYLIGLLYANGDTANEQWKQHVEALHSEHKAALDELRDKNETLFVEAQMWEERYNMELATSNKYYDELTTAQRRVSELTVKCDGYSRELEDQERSLNVRSSQLDELESFFLSLAFLEAQRSEITRLDEQVKQLQHAAELREDNITVLVKERDDALAAYDMLASRIGPATEHVLINEGIIKRSNAQHEENGEFYYGNAFAGQELPDSLGNIAGDCNCD